MAEETKPTESNNRGSAQNAYDYESGRITVTITLAEYRELVGKAALYDEQQRAYDEMASYAGE